MPPLVSIILPTYNRARFLPEALASINDQRWRNWELIVVDDGSTDGSSKIVEQAGSALDRPVKYVFQQNRGAYAARNTGLDHAEGDYVAFFDSDDLWLPGYLEECMTAALANPDVDWVYAACRMVDLPSGNVLAPSTFYVEGKPRPFLTLKTRAAGELRILTDQKTLQYATSSGLFSGFQNSVIHRRVFARHDPPIFPTAVGEDVMTCIRAIARGSQLGYIDKALVIYHVHDGNLSAASRTSSFAKRRASVEAFANALSLLGDELKDHAQARRLLRRAASESYFWRVGYGVLWQGGRRSEALAAYRKALRLWPWNVLYWKTYLLAVARARLGVGPGDDASQ